MKKLFALILAILMLFSFVSCNDETGDQSQTQTEDKTKNKDSDGKDIKNNEITFSGLVVVDTEKCAIKVTKINSDDMWGYTLKVQLENKSSDQTFLFSLESAAINGVQCDSIMMSEVPAGKKANEEITFWEDYDIGDYTDIELTFEVCDADDLMTDSILCETVHVYPYGEDKATEYVRVPQASDEIIMDNEYVTVIVTDYENDSDWGYYSVELFMVNKTDKNLILSADEVSVNGYMTDPFYMEFVSSKKQTFSSILWSTDEFEENEIVDVEEIEFKLSVYDEDDWFDESYDEDDWFFDDLVCETVVLRP